jgi:hypothetical protein
MLLTIPSGYSSLYSLLKPGGDGSIPVGDGIDGSWKEANIRLLSFFGWGRAITAVPSLAGKTVMLRETEIHGQSFG